jgi:hypothetical protein
MLQSQEELEENLEVTEINTHRSGWLLRPPPGVFDEEEELSVTDDIDQRTENELLQVYDSLADSIEDSQFSFDEIRNFLA